MHLLNNQFVSCPDVKSGGRAALPLVDSPRRNEGRRLDPKAADDVLPHRGGRDIEDGLRADRGRDPGTLRELVLELPGSPARVAEQYAHPIRRIARDDAEHFE